MVALVCLAFFLRIAVNLSMAPRDILSSIAQSMRSRFVSGNTISSYETSSGSRMFSRACEIYILIILGLISTQIGVH